MSRYSPSAAFLLGIAMNNPLSPSITLMSCTTNSSSMVMDTTATSLSMDNHIPVLLFALKDPENIIRALCGENVGRLDRMRTVRELMDELVTEWRQNL